MRTVARMAGAIVALATPAAADVAVTVYNQNLGLVSERRSFELQGGFQNLQLTEVAALIDPSSVRIKFPGAAVDLHEQNYRYDLVNTQAILNRYLDKSLRLVTIGGEVYDGTLLSAGSMYVLQTPRELKLVNPQEVLQVDLARLPEGFYTRPTLDWLVASTRPGTVKAEVSYLTRGIGWRAEYVAHLNADDTKIDLSGWASVDNQSGATYRDAKLKLIAGDIHRAPPPIQPIAREQFMAAEAAPRAGFEERAFFEYHLYDLPRRTTVADKETKQIALFEPATAGVRKKYLYRPYKEPKKVAVVVEFKNSKGNGLGMALPAGVVRVTKSDRDGSEQLLGEDRIDHTPKDETLTLEVGNAFDLAAEYIVRERRQVTRSVTELDASVKLRNHKAEEVTIGVEQKVPGWSEWRILKSSHAFEKIDAVTFRFQVPVKPDAEQEITYTIRYGS